MSLSHDDYDFGGSTLHSIVSPSGPAELPISVGRFPAVKGTSHLIGQLQDRPLECQYILKGYEDPEDLQDVLDEIDGKAGELTGTLTETGNYGQTYENCTFIGFDRGIPFKDGSGQHDWCVEGRLRWIQRKL